MQSISFKDPVTGDSFSSNTYEVRRNGSGNVLRAKAPSGATAVKMQSTFDGVDDAPMQNQFADDITQDELENFAEDMQESMNIATNPPGGFSSRYRSNHICCRWTRPRLMASTSSSKCRIR